MRPITITMTVSARSWPSVTRPAIPSRPTNGNKKGGTKRGQALDFGVDIFNCI